MESPALIFGDFPKRIFKISSLCTGTKNTFGSPQKSGDFPKSICEISSLCSLTKNAFVPLQNYLWQAYKIKHFWRAVGSIPTAAMLKVTQRHTTVFAGSAAGRALERESECLSKREILEEFPLLRAHFAKHFLYAYKVSNFGKCFRKFPLLRSHFAKHFAYKVSDFRKCFSRFRPKPPIF